MQIALLHLLPGLAVGTFYLVTAEAFAAFGIPRLLALLLGFVLVGMPIQLVVISRSVVRNREPLPIWQYLAGAAGLVVFIMLLLRLPLGVVSRYLATHVFAWLPPAFTPSADDQLDACGRSIVLFTLVFQLIVDGIVNPIVEETYFRGVLLPRLGGLRWAAPVVNTLLFALGHVWQPYNVVSIFIYVLPLTLFTWWRRNYYVQAFVHCLANTFGAVLALVAFFRG